PATPSRSGPSVRSHTRQAVEPAAAGRRGTSSLWPRGNLDPRLRARLHARIVATGRLAGIPLLRSLCRRRRRHGPSRRDGRLRVEEYRGLLDDDRRRRIDQRRRVVPIWITPPRTDADTDEDPRAAVEAGAAPCVTRCD